MTLMRHGKVIAHAKQTRNLFTLDLAHPGRAMAVTIQPKAIATAGQARAMAITGQGRPIHIVSQNKHIRLWHRGLAHVSNARVVRATKLVDGISFEQENKKYNPAEVLVDSDDSDAPVNSDEEELPTQLSAEATIAALHQTIENPDVIDKLCTLCIGSKSTRVVRRNKSMTATMNKLKKVHAVFWGSHDPPLQSESIYAAILMCEHIQKTWTFYLRGKDDFVDVFQT